MGRSEKIPNHGKEHGSATGHVTATAYGKRERRRAERGLSLDVSILVRVRDMYDGAVKNENSCTNIDKNLNSE